MDCCSKLNRWKPTQKQNGEGEERRVEAETEKGKEKPKEPKMKYVAFFLS